ncbi:SDR family NAD(P)-dependent oxidoreductase [Selenomonas sp. TAMA-11512]|uniref:SDR family NAD(P)-dependent oxidoreductase n=1 Tax=Selenomonas sp. TAMA-11512 TaxID=3095337 RepID=UPI00308C7DAD|nr:SDR family NAD(P)-dependent oxidoreductase [Selenomonas sp. TAMA-11512]
MSRTVMVTGATSGIGWKTAKAFAKYGDNLVICGRRADLLEARKKKLEQYGAKVYAFTLNVRDRQDVEATIPKIPPPIDILVNNAGLAQGLDDYQDSSLDDVETMIDTNVKGLLYITRLVLPQMIARDQGHIINIGSTAGIYAYAKGAVYCATKAAVKTLSDGIRIDVIKSNIKVTTIQPGLVETDFSKVRFHGDSERAATVYQGVEPLQPEDIADIILYTANQPRWVQISDVTIMATKQATGFMIARD